MDYSKLLNESDAHKAIHNSGIVLHCNQTGSIMPEYAENYDLLIDYLNNNSVYQENVSAEQTKYTFPDGSSIIEHDENLEKVFTIKPYIA